MPYFLRAENNSRGESAYHGASGPLSVQDLRYKSSLTGAFVAAAQASGMPANDDFNGPQQDGVGYYQVTQRGGRRWSAADAYLHPAAEPAEPDHPHRRPGHRHRRSRAAGRSASATCDHGVEEVAGPKARYILAAGAIGSPQLLMLSGIGPADHLREHNIAVMADSQGVGANLSDHPVVTAMWSTPKRARPVGEVRAEEPGPLAAHPLRPDVHQHRRGGRLHQDRPVAARAGHPVARAAGARTRTSAWPTRPAGRCPC